MKYLYGIGLATILVFASSARLSFDPLMDHLVAYYSFNHCDARDDSGNGSDGQLFGEIDCWCGIEDDGLLLDGQRDFIEFYGKVNAYFTTSDFTISFYIKPEQYTFFAQSLLSKREECTEEHMMDILLDYRQGIIDTKVHQSEYKYYGGLSPKVDPSGWMHFALVRTGSEAFTFINGEIMQESIRCSGVDISNDAPLSFGNSPCVKGGRGQRFKGVLDELRVFDRALSADEIKALYDLHPIENAARDCYS
ncbi:MAG: LamG domain-containing protein [Saprospiraceae bacterium]